MKNVKLHLGAREDLKSGIEWYDAQLYGLGKVFKKTIKDTILKIQRKPSWYLTEEEPKLGINLDIGNCFELVFGRQIICRIQSGYG